MEHRKRKRIKINKMPNQDSVVLQPSNGLFLKTFTDNYSNLTWGTLSQAYIFPTLSEAEGVATAINAGTVGTIRPQV
jgi:hypothetical protein